MTGAGTSAGLGRLAAAPRVLLLVPARTYRAADFLLAAARMGLDLVIGSDGALPLGGRPVIRGRRARSSGSMPCLRVTSARLQPWHPPSRRTRIQPPVTPATVGGDGRVDLGVQDGAGSLGQVSGGFRG